MKLFQYIMTTMLSTLISICYANCSSKDLDRIKSLVKAYPDHLKAVDENHLIWSDGTVMALECDKVHTNPIEKINDPVLADQVIGAVYHMGEPFEPIPYTMDNDPGRARYLPFFMKMYGSTEAQVKANLTMIYWMPRTFGTMYPLMVTKVNNVDKLFISISSELDKLVSMHPDYQKFLANPAETFDWRKIAGTDRLSPHSFGMTIDINKEYSQYWQWDLKKEGKDVSESTPLTYRNLVPGEIVEIFEKHGFIWGGKWYHYDTMHFEYRMELLESSSL